MVMLLKSLLSFLFFFNDIFYSFEISYTDYAVGNVIVRHQSKVKIKASGNAKVFVNLIDEAKVEIEATENAEVIIYNYGPQTNYSNKGNVIVKRTSWER